MAPKTNGQKLLALARQRFPRLTSAECRMFMAAGDGDVAALPGRLPDLAHTPHRDQDLKERAAWTIRPDRLVWLLTDSDTATLIHPRGIRISRAYVPRGIDLFSRNILVNLFLSSCFVDGSINLVDAAVRGSVFLVKCLIAGANGIAIIADRCCTDSALSLEQTTAIGAIQLLGASLGGPFKASDARFFGTNMLGKGHVALGADGLRCVGGVELDRSICDGMVSLHSTRIRGQIRAREAEFRGGDTPDMGRIAILAEGMECADGVFLDHSSCSGIVRLYGATLYGPLLASHATFEGSEVPGQGRQSLNADGMRCSGSVFLDHAKFNGTIRLRDSSIQGRLAANDSNVQGSKPQEGDDLAIAGDRLRCRGGFFLDRTECKGIIRLHSAQISMALSAIRAELQGGKSATGGFVAIHADRLRCRGDVFLNHTTCTGVIRLHGADIAGAVELVSATLWGGKDNAGTYQALHLYEARLLGTLFLDRDSNSDDSDSCTIRGKINLQYATIRGSVVLREIELIPSNARRLEAMICADHATIENDLSITNNNNDNGLLVGNFDCRNIRIHGDLVFDNNLLTADNDTGPFRTVNFANATVGGRMVWKGMRCGPKAKLDLSHAQVGELDDDLDTRRTSSWPQPGNLVLFGFTYQKLSTLLSRESRLRWLQRQHPDLVSPWWTILTRPLKPEFYVPQPFDQLARVFDASHDEDDARFIRIEKLKARARTLGTPHDHRGTWSAVALWCAGGLAMTFAQDSGFGPLMGILFIASLLAALAYFGILPRVWQLLLLAVVGFGYQMHRAGYWLAGLWLVGTGVFSYAKQHECVVPLEPDVLTSKEYTTSGQIPNDYPPFHPLMYSLDCMLPIIDLQQESKWTVVSSHAQTPTAFMSWCRPYLYFHIGAGWLLSTLLLAGLTGIARQK